MTPQDLKLGVTNALNALLEPIRQEFANSPEFQKAFELAYPKPGKKIKKVKDKGSKYPGTNPTKTAKGNAGVEASERTAEDIITNKEQVQSAGESVEEALKTLSVSDTPK